MTQIKPKGTQLDIQSVANEIAADPTAIGSIATGVTSDPGAVATLDLDYLRRDGTGAMTADLDLGNFDVLNVVNVAGRNVAADGLSLDNHVADLNIHRTINDVGATATDLWSGLKITNELALKSDKVLAATVGNFAGLDASGNITDSGSNASTFALAVHTHVAADISDFAAVASAAAPVQSVAGKTGTVTLVEGDITDLGTYETAFAKNTAFNKNFGALAGDVCEGNDSRLSDARTPLSHTHVEADITDLQSYLLDITGQSISSLNDVFTTMSPTNGQVLTYDFANTRWDAVTPVDNDTTDHTLLTNIGTNSHTQIDNHIADTTIHFTQAAISITESQVSDLQSYLLDITGQSINSLNDVFTAMTPVDGQVLTFDTTNGWQSETLPVAPVTSVAGKTGVVTLVEADITDLGTYETAFAKNTAFNKNFGTLVGDVCEGNDARLSDARTPLSHTHVEADITDLGTIVATVATPTFTGTVGFPTYTVGTLPAQAAGHQIYVSDATGASLTGSMCFSNGTVWIDVTTGIAVV